MSNILNISEYGVDLGITNLLGQIVNKKEKFDYVVGIANGGLNISIPISQHLNVPHKSITIKFYNDDNTANEIPKKIDFTEIQNIDKKSHILLVDDLIDSGASISYFKNNFDLSHKTAILYWNKTNKYNIIPDYYYYEKPKLWLSFPWERTTNGKSNT